VTGCRIASCTIELSFASLVQEICRRKYIFLFVAKIRQVADKTTSSGVLAENDRFN
jgi:hypothetical protein